MRVLGIDPGSRFMGYGVIDDVGGRLRHVAHGVIRADVDAPLEMRLKGIFADLSTAIALYRPEGVAVEGLFTFRNARSAIILGHARGVALLAAAQIGLPVHEYSPAQVKKSVGAGGADGKDAVARMVRVLLQIADVERADASDALAVAICHLNRRRSPPTSSRGRGARNAVALLGDRLAPAYRNFEAEK